MTTEIQIVFEHPEERAAISAGGDFHDRISLRDHLVEVDIGAFQKERGARQRIVFNVVVEVHAAPQPLDDDVDRILSYDRITEAIAVELAAERLNLLETLAERVAERILAEPQAKRVFVRIEKLDVGPYKLGVEIVRARAGSVLPEQEIVRQDTMTPIVVFLDNSAIAAPDLSSRLDDLQKLGLPVILAVGLPDCARPMTGQAATQLRVDLLAIEQNAWALAARDPRCIVMASRTEIDWAVKRGRMMVWAPAKMVLDTVNGPDASEPVRLAQWLAEQMSASRLIVHGNVAVPAGSGVALERR